MNEILPPDTNALSVITEKNVVQFFAEKGLDPVIEKIKAEVAAFKPDMTTEVGRKEIASFAFKIAKMKTRMDELGKNLVSGIKAQAKIIDAERGRAWDIIEALQHQVRKPLTEWEEKDKVRVANHKAALDTISGSLVLPINVAIAEIEARLEVLKTFVDKDFEEFSDLAKQTLNNAIEQLTQKLEAMKKAEADAAELARLKKAEDDRLQKEREQKIADEAAAKAKADAEEKAKRDAEAEKKRVDDEKAAAEKKAKDDADAAAAREKAEKDRADKAEADKKAAAEKAEKDKEAAVQAERDRAAAEKKKADDEAAVRERNKKHKAKINNEALNAIVTHCNSEKIDVTPEIAKAVVEAIAKGEIPHVKITY